MYAGRDVDEQLNVFFKKVQLRNVNSELKKHLILFQIEKSNLNKPFDIISIGWLKGGMH